MTGTEVADVETQAERIAARGREALLGRIRRAYSDAAAAHADLISLDDEQIEAIVQSATDRADGLQWRRALAAVAADELAVSATEALAHPAVIRAQQLVGAPSYEQSLAEMIARPVPPPAPSNGNGSVAGSVVSEADVAEADVAEADVAEADVAEADVAEADVPEAGVPEPEPPAPQPPLPDPIPEPPAPDPEPDPEPVPGPALAQTDLEPGGVALALAERETEAADVAPPSDELETVEADDVLLELLPEPDPIEYETEAYDVEADFAHERVPPAPVNPFPAPAARHADDPQPQGDQEADEELGGRESDQPAQEEPETELVIAAVHLGGVANLPTKRDGLSVRLSADGLDIMHGAREIIGRLIWDEIEALEVPNLRVRRRSKQLRARLVVRTPHGDASFDVPDVAGDDLRARVEPIMELYGRH